MNNFIEQDGFIEFLNNRIIEDKIVYLKISHDISYILQIINIIYETKTSFINVKIPIENNYFFLMQINLIE